MKYLRNNLRKNLGTHLRKTMRIILRNLTITIRKNPGKYLRENIMANLGKNLRKS